jgi:hypothetical protein
VGFCGIFDGKWGENGPKMAENELIWSILGQIGDMGKKEKEEKNGF